MLSFSIEKELLNLQISNPLLKHVKSEIANLGARYFYNFKLVFDSKHISNFRLVKNLPENNFLSWSKIEKNRKFQPKYSKNG